MSDGKRSVSNREGDRVRAVRDKFQATEHRASIWRLLFSLSDPTQGPSGQERGPHSASRHRRPTGGTKLKVGSAPLTDRPSLTIFCVSDTVCPDRRTRHAQRSERNWARNAPTDRRAPAGPGRRAASGRPDGPTRPTAGRGPRTGSGRADRPTDLSSLSCFDPAGVLRWRSQDIEMLMPLFFCFLSK